MAKAEWGVKRICLSCGARFYDLQRSPITCPKCSSEFQAEDFLRSRRSRPQQEKAAKRKELPVEVEAPGAADEEAVIAVEPDAEDEVIEDTEELGKDEDDIPEIAEGEEEA
ncbi:MAG: TIGR02300 family protein [Alphaproteobacteria bacterium]|nr:TIGR02300 family protein [Alphaproteobacteria bacterium]